MGEPVLETAKRSDAVRNRLRVLAAAVAHGVAALGGLQLGVGLAGSAHRSAAMAGLGTRARTAEWAPRGIITASTAARPATAAHTR